MLSTKIWLEANTERSESNPGRSLGITNNSLKNHVFCPLYK